MRLNQYSWRKVLFMVLVCLVMQIQSVQADGLKIKLEADKKEYARNEVAWMTLTIENNSEKDVFDVDIRHVLPNGLEYVADEDGRQYYDVISAGDRVTCRVAVQRITSDIDISVSSDKKIYEYGEVAVLTITVKNNTDKPMYNMSIHHVLPYKLEYADTDEEGYAYFKKVPANGAITRRVLVSSKYPDILVTLDADQDEYQPNGVACLTMTIKNRSENTLKNVRVEHLLPEGLIYAEQQGNNPVEFASIMPNEMVQSKIYVQYISNEASADNADDLPMTGDASDRLFGIAVVGFCISMMLLGLISKNRNNERRRMN